MSGYRDFASLLSGGLQGGSTGVGAAAGLKMAGMAVPGPWTPWLIGGGAALGALGSFLGSKADEEETPEEREAKRREKGLSMFRNNVGRGLRARTKPSNFGEMLNGPA